MNVYLCAPHTYKGLTEAAMDLYIAGAASAGNASSVWKTNKPADAMNIFLAGTHAEKNRANSQGDFAQRISVLESFYYVQDWMDPYIQKHWDFLLDSGAFTFMQANTKGVDWVEYVERYAAYINRLNIAHFFELDIDAVVGLRKVEELRTILERLTGKQSIPVWHHSRGRDYWQRMCDEYKYVAIGGMVSDVKYRNRIEPLFPYFLGEASKRRTKVHGLGYTSLVGLTKYRFHSVDSTAWVYGNRSGFIYMFNGKTITKISAPAGMQMKSKAVAVHNFREWVKFQRYAKDNL